MSHSFEEIISLENLCLAWQEFIVGKKAKMDVQIFSRHLMDNILTLHEDLANGNYQHGGYESFYVNDPKRRHIHKASVRDRLLHHAVYRILYPFFDKTFIADSFFCRLDKGLHKAINRFRTLAFRASSNYTITCWALKCDIQKFFASIDKGILFEILGEYISDEKILRLLSNIINSFHSDLNSVAGLPLGNLTSQLFANVYLNFFDQWVKHILKAKFYIRYADDFVFFSSEKQWLVDVKPRVRDFLQDRLRLNLHPNKISFKTLASGVDFLGWEHFPDHRVLRCATRHRMYVRVRENPTPETLQSYLGLLNHGNTYGVRKEMLGRYWLWAG